MKLNIQLVRLLMLLSLGIVSVTNTQCKGKKSRKDAAAVTNPTPPNADSLPKGEVKYSVFFEDNPFFRQDGILPGSEIRVVIVRASADGDSSQEIEFSLDKKDCAWPDIRLEKTETKNTVHVVGASPSRFDGLFYECRPDIVASVKGSPQSEAKRLSLSVAQRPWIDRLVASVSRICAIRIDASAFCWNGRGTKAEAFSTFGPMKAWAEVESFGCILKPDKSVACAGENTQGQLGNEQTSVDFVMEPVQAKVGPASSLAVGDDFACALLSDATVSCWGSNLRGRRGNDSMEAQILTATAVKNLSQVKKIVAGADFGCALRQNATVACWGSNEFGQLAQGDGANAFSLVPLDIALTDIVDLSAAQATVCAVRSNGEVYCWGRKQEFPQSVAARTLPELVGTLTNAQQVHVGYEHSCAIRRDGLMSCWGSNVRGQLGAGEEFNALSNSASAPQAVVNVKPVIGAALGESLSCALHSDDSVSCWGRLLPLSGVDQNGTKGLPTAIEFEGF
jgi:alpha-tubulin suppressor-like RCC1 family protein